jgi:hypothetical protein
MLAFEVMIDKILAEITDNNGTKYSISLTIWETKVMSFRIWETNNDNARIRYVNGGKVDWCLDGTDDWFLTPPEVKRFIDDMLVRVLRNRAFL